MAKGRATAVEEERNVDQRAGDRGCAGRDRIFAKVSREELAAQFYAPPPPKLVQSLLESGAITEEAARLSDRLPLAQDVVAEADSAGHTDSRPALVLFPTFAVLRDQLAEKHRYPVRLGVAGGISSPHTVLAAFLLGADFVVTGSINQACVEVGTSSVVKEMLAQALVNDVGLAPAAHDAPTRRAASGWADDDRQGRR